MERSIKEVKGIGEVRARQLKALGVETVADMLYYFPRGFEDRTHLVSIFEAQDGETASVFAVATGNIQLSYPRRGFSVTRQTFTDESGVIDAVWFNNPYIKRMIHPNERYYLYGKIQAKYRRKEILTPSVCRASEGLEIVPVYHLKSSLTQNALRLAVRQCLEITRGSIPETIPDYIRRKYNIAEIEFSMQNIHFPKDKEAFDIARRRFVFEEFLELGLGLGLMRGEKQSEKTEAFSSFDDNGFFARLPYRPTGAQTKVISEIRSDLAKQTPMQRLVQGDVGCGKTVVAAYALYQAVHNGFQAVMMAPTEILAAQHYETVSALFPDIETVFLSGSLKASEKRAALEKISSGKGQIILGTHALIQEGVEYNDLKLVITDEQHRFGVRQRSALALKGIKPHTLIMSATPIPRTLSLILYGDLDVSVIDELPPGRQRTETYAIGSDKCDRAYAFIRKNIESGMQAYVICPLVEENEVSELHSVQKHCEEISGKYFNGFKTEFIHGKMKAAEKDEIMHRFVSGETNVLVATTLIEVGVNVPTANIMIIENAECFGLSQLHQLRGRIGRGKDKAYCILVSDSKNDTTQERMKTMCSTTDGFKISEKDLKLRGPGDFFGTRQHGLPELKIANIFEDMPVLKEAIKASKEILECDKKLKNNPYLKKRIQALYKDDIVF